MNIQQCFELLEINQDATISEIKQAYRDLIRVWHPDRFSNNVRLRDKAGEKVKEYNAAYERLLSFLSSEYESGCEPECEPVSGFASKRIITVASGKGGVGKTNFSVNIAIALNQLKEKVMILDADLGMANIDVLCGLTPKYNLEDVIDHGKSFEDVVLDVFGGVKIIPGVSGVENLTSLDREQQHRFFTQMGRYEEIDDTRIVFIDTGAGMGPPVINFMLAGTENIIITTPEPTSIMDAYALIKTILGKNPKADISLVVNMVKNREEGIRIFSSIHRITKTFLDSNINYLGHIVYDRSVSRSVKQQKPYYLTHPSGKTGTCIKEIAVRMIDRQNETVAEGGIRNFFKRMSSLILKSTNSK